MTRKQIDQAREVRLWIGQIVIPAVGVAFAFPEVRERAKEQFINAKSKVKDLFHRK